MNIRNKYCLLSELTQAQVDKLKGLMPDTMFFDSHPHKGLIGFDYDGYAGTWSVCNIRAKVIVSYGEMLSLLGVEKKEKLVPHVHQKEIIAWANGGAIEVRGSLGGAWYPANPPEWLLHQKYRVNPKLTPTQLRIKELAEEIQKLKEQDAVERGVNIVLGEVDASN